MATISQAPAVLDLVGVKGDDLTITLSVTESSVAYDWTGATVATQILDTSGTVLATNFTTSTPANGTLVLSLTDTNTTAIGVGTFRYWVSVTKSSATRTWLAGAFTVMQAGWGGTSTSSASLAITTGSATVAISSVTGGTAGGIAVTDTADYYRGVNVETVLAELPTKFRRIYSGNTLIAIGDSLIATSTNGQWVDQLAVLSGGAFVTLRNAGIAGNTSTAMLARISTDVIAYAPVWCIVQATGNDASQSVSVATAINNYKTMIALLLKNNIKPVFTMGAPSDTTATRDFILQVNNAMSAWCYSQGIPVLDLYTALVDPTDGTYLAAYTSDGTHPSSAGVGAAATFNVNLLPQQMTRRPLALAAGANDPVNLASNGLFLTDTNADGLSDNWLKTGTGNVSRTAVTAGYGLGFWQNLSPIDTTQTQIYQDISTTTGNEYEVAVRVKASTSGYRMRVTGVGDIPVTNVQPSLGDITEAQGAVISMRFVAPTTSTRIFLAAGGAAGTTSFAQFTVRNMTALAALG